MDGIRLGMELRRKLPGIGTVLLSNHADPRFVSNLSRWEVSGWSYLLKKSVRDLSTLERAIEGAVDGTVMLDPQLVAGMQPRPGGRLAGLSGRQHEILALLAQGFSNAAIAEQLVLAEKSVENALSRLYEQLGIATKEGSVHARVQAVLLYMRESRTPSAGGGSALV